MVSIAQHDRTFCQPPTLDLKVVEWTLVSQNTRQNCQYRGGWRALLRLPLINVPDDEQLRRWFLGANIKARIPSGVSYLVPFFFFFFFSILGIYVQQVV